MRPRDREYIKQYLKLGKYLGDGIHGRVYKSNPRTVIKVTEAYEEALFYAWLYGMKSRFTCFPKVYEVFELPSRDFWAIWREDIHNLKSSESSFWQVSGGHHMIHTSSVWGLTDTERQSFNKQRYKTGKALFEQFVNSCARMHTKYKIRLDDAHEDNVGIRKIGPHRKAVLRDLSCCLLPKGKKTWAKRFIIELDE